jgi:hypothetical protein
MLNNIQDALLINGQCFLAQFKIVFGILESLFMVIDVESRTANLYRRNSRQKLALRTRSLVRGVGFAHQFTSTYKRFSRLL